ncbi:biotin transporter BioY [Anaerobacillus sp. MEB173]|uniref:biotin transporter BioY n=1 Tax=Anaerobacillus sp. MEB173 TaxID=3383345 RepID=UPI003F905C35
MNRSSQSIVNMMYIAMMAAVIAVLGLIPPITLGFTPVPITAQTFGIMLAGAALGARRGSLAVILFLLLVAFGVPALSGGRGGLGVFVTPWAGYLYSYPIAALFIGYVIDRMKHLNFSKMLIVNLIGGIVIIHAVGVVWFQVFNGVTFGAALVAASFPFLIGDTLKAILAATVALALRKAMPRLRTDKQKVQKNIAS